MARRRSSGRFVRWLNCENVQRLASEYERIAPESRGFWGDDWAGGSSADALRVLRRGDLDAVPEAEGRASMINDAVDLAGVRPEWVPEVVGAFANVPAFLAGDPCSMWQRSPVQDERGEISVYINVCASSSVTAEELRRRGVCVLAAVLALSRVRSVRVVAYSSQEFLPVSVRLAYPLDVSELCAVVTRPSVFRRAMLEHAGLYHYKKNGSTRVGWCSWSEVMGGDERAAVLRDLGDGSPALVLTPHKLGSWAGLSDSQFVERLNAMIQAVNDGGDLGAV